MVLLLLVVIEFLSLLIVRLVVLLIVLGVVAVGVVGSGFVMTITGGGGMVIVMIIAILGETGGSHGEGNQEDLTENHSYKKTNNHRI